MAPARDRVSNSERLISRVLRFGVGLSILLVSAGTAISFLTTGGAYGAAPSEVARLTGAGGSFPRTATWLLEGLVHLDGQAIIVAGLIVLILTPLVRVAVSVVAFAKERDHAYTAITAAVLFMLLLSFALGKAG
jgi:uncharacterized membrane protein